MRDKVRVEMKEVEELDTEMGGLDEILERTE